MSIEPEVPYNFEDDEASDNEDGWRDAGVRSVQNTPQRPLVDVYIPNTRSDTPVSRASTRTFTDTTVV